MNERHHIKALGTTFSIIDCLAESGPRGVTELANELDTPKSTVHNHLNSLREIGFVSRDDTTYYISPRVLTIGEHVRESFDIFEIAKPELHKLAAKTHEHVSLMIEEDGYGVYLYTAEGDDTIRKLAPDGTATKLHVTAPGKAILASVSEKHRRDIVNRHGLEARTEKTITDVDTLNDELETIRSQGYATDEEEAIEGLQGIAAPILPRDGGTVHGAISVYGPATRQMEHYTEATLDELLRVVNIVQVEMRYRHNHNSTGTRQDDQ